MHTHSLDCYTAEEARFSAREEMIHGKLVAVRHAATDRQVAGWLGFADMNAVRPRITELIERGWVEECGATRCPVTGKTVRLVRGLRERKEREPGQLVLL